MNNIEFVQKLNNIATNYKTLYVLGVFGWPMTSSNKTRAMNGQSYNRSLSRKPKVNAATADTFGFDCVNLLKAVLWGWNGDKNRAYGGATYESNGVPDINANIFFDRCKNPSADFSNIEVGEAVWMKDHIGVYVGNGLAVECTPRWEDGVQITAVHNIGKKSGYNGRSWTKHGKIPYIEYVKESKPVETKPAETKTEYGLDAFIRDIQSACGAVVDGIAGPQTLSKTVTVSAIYNRRHAVVKAIQRRLFELGYVEVGTADGVAGPKFTSAVTHFQRDNGCVVDGIITKRNKTWKKLLGMA